MSRSCVNASHLSPAVEDYLRAILTLAGDAGATTVCALAEWLAVSRASASQMVRRLADLGFVTHDPYGSVSLTEGGTTHAGAILRRFNLLESYLVTALGYDPASVDREADRIEHAMSPQLTERLAELLSTQTLAD